MKKCTYCSGELEDTAIVCHHCAKSLYIQKVSATSIFKISWIVVTIMIILMSLGVVIRLNRKQEAIAVYTKAIKINPNDAVAYKNRGNAYRDKGKYDEAVSDYTIAIKINPNYAEAYNELGVAYDRKSNYDDAIVEYNKAIEIEPKYAKAYCNRGFARNEKGDYDAHHYMNPNINSIASKETNFDYAISDYNKAIEIDPNFADAYLRRGFTYHNKGLYDEATSDFTKAIEISPNFAFAYSSRGTTYYKQGNVSRAISDFTKAIGINPKFAVPYFCRGVIYDQQGNFTQAISDYTKAISINHNDATAYCKRGNTYAKQDKSTQAISDFTRAIVINPNYAEAYNNRGIMYYNIKEYDKARTDVYKAGELGFKVDPSLLEALKKSSGENILNSSVAEEEQIDCSEFKVSNIGAILFANKLFSSQPEKCTLYTLGGSVVTQKLKNGYLLTCEYADPYNNPIFLETDKTHGQGTMLQGYIINGKPSGEWAYYVGKTTYTTITGFEKEILVFHEKFISQPPQSASQPPQGYQTNLPPAKENIWDYFDKLKKRE